MKLGRWKASSTTCCSPTASRNYNQIHFNCSGATSARTTWLLPSCRASQKLQFHCRGLSRHLLHGLVIMMVFCTVLFLQVTVMSIQVPAAASVPAAADGELSAANRIIGDSCESCGMTNGVRNKNQGDGGRTTKDLHMDFAPETSASNYNYLYNDQDNESGWDETEATKSGDTPFSSSLINSGFDNLGTGQFLPEYLSNDLLQEPASQGRISQAKDAVKTRRRNKQLQNSHYRRRQKLLDSVFITVKTTKRYHATRLEPILSTWFNLAREQTWIFTDADDPLLDKRTGGHMINTNCPASHHRQALCCKMSAEFDTFIQSQKSWFCHVDDDNYVNVPALLDLLEKYDPKEHHYLGKPSLKSPILFKDPDSKSDDVSFWFGTGGAGFCISRSLALRMSPLASGGKFSKLCDRIQLPDDVTIGYVAGHLLGQNLTVIPQFHSHFETMRLINMKNPHSEITFSYVRDEDHVNVLNLKGYFNDEEDPTRFLSLHCLLFPNFSFCPKGSNRVQ